jgi:hypothetical protein
MCDDDVTIGVTEVVNNIQVTAQPNDQIIDIDVIDNSDEVTLNVTPCLIEVNINKGSSFARWGTIYGNILDQVDLQSALDLKADLVSGKVPSNQLPSYVDDVIEVANFAALPTVGETGKIYITLDTNKIYRWSGSAYIEITTGGSVWGAITGTLSNQTDLQTALDAKQPLDGDLTSIAGLTGTDGLLRKTAANTYSLDTNTYALDSSLSGYLPLSGGTLASSGSTNTLNINHSSGSGVAASITKGGNGEALTVLKTSGSGNAASILGGVTLLDELHLNTDLADAYIASAATWNAKQNALNGTGFVKASGTTISYDNNTYALDSVVVKLTGDQTIAGNKTFTTTGRTTFQNADLAQVSFKNTIDLTKTLIIGQGSSNSNIFSSTGLDFRVGGLTTSALLIESNENATFKENVTANSFIKSGGTPSQILAADGSVLTAGTNITISGGVISSSGGSVGSLEFNATDLTVWNNGKSNVATNTSFGDGALKSNTSGGFNVAYGGNSLMNNTTGGANVSIGGLTLQTNTTGNHNVAVGLSALFDNTTGTNNVAIGSGALGTNTTGLNNAALGAQAGGFAGSTAVNNTTSSDSVFIGANTRPLATNQTNQIVIGNNAIGHGSNTVTLGNSSIVTTILRGNVGIGNTNPLNKLHITSNSGSGNPTLGVSGGSLFLSGDNNLYGLFQGVNTTTGDSWFQVMRNDSAVAYNLLLQPAGGNISIGTATADAKLRVSGLFNGTHAIFGNVNGRGLEIATSLAAGTNEAGSVLNARGAGSGTMIFQTEGSERMRITSGGNVVINNLGTGTVYSNAGTLTNTNPSDERLKENIDDLEYGLTEILQLRPVSYNWINDTANQGKQFGFIAQEVQEIMPDLINEFTITEDEEEVVRLGLDKEAIFVAMVNAIKELKAEIELLKQK